MVQIVNKFYEKSYHECLKRSLKYDSICFGPTNIYNYIYIDTNTDHFPLLTLHMRGRKRIKFFRMNMMLIPSILSQKQ